MTNLNPYSSLVHCSEILDYERFNAIGIRNTKLTCHICHNYLNEQTVFSLRRNGLELIHYNCLTMRDLFNNQLVATKDLADSNLANLKLTLQTPNANDKEYRINKKTIKICDIPLLKGEIIKFDGKRALITCKNEIKVITDLTEINIAIRRGWIKEYKQLTFVNKIKSIFKF